MALEIVPRTPWRAAASEPIIDEMRIAFVMTVALGALSGALSAQQPPHEGAADGPSAKYMGNPQAVASGQELYEAVCSGCHGVNGEGGRGPNLITGRNVRRASDEELFDAINNGIPGTDMPPSPLEPDKIWQLAAFVRSLSAPAYEQPLTGDPEAGKEVYFSKAKCNGCHMIRGTGGYLGPDLTNAGISGPLIQLREALLEPNKRLTEGFRPVVVTLPDGGQIRGVAKNNSNYSIQVLDRDGRLHLLQERNLKQVDFQEKSWMPADYSQRLNETEINDLLAFLSRQSIRRSAGQ
jgi:putative heme-binding domain-containing protein